MGVDDLSITTGRVDRVMNSYRREILSVHREDTLAVVSREFERKRTAIAMVVDDDGRLLGTVSLGDIVHAIGEHGAGAIYFPVRMIMSYSPVTCGPHEPAERAAE